MIWAKRRFAYANFAPYSDRMEQLAMANPTLYREFIMVSTKGNGPGEAMYYVGVPHETFMAGFNGFGRVNESALPKLIDSVQFADTTTEEFTGRFEFKHKKATA